MPHSLLETDLRLLDLRLAELQGTAYFNPAIIEFTAKLRQALDKVLSAQSVLPTPVRAAVLGFAWQVTQYLSGSTTKLQPYEAVYGLECVLHEWKLSDTLIVTSLVAERNFFFHAIPKSFYQFVEDDLGVKLGARLVQIGLPDLYRSKPLFTVALYHELGHFIDDYFNITDTVLLIEDGIVLPGLTAPETGQSEDEFEQQQLSHLREYFADLFAGSYCGRAIRKLLDDFAGGNDASKSHPATYDRLQQLDELLSNKSTNVIDIFNRALSARGLPSLGKRYSPPTDLEKALNDLRPVVLGNRNELHGIYEIGWDFLDAAMSRDREPWSAIAPQDIERIVNDLVSKSIRSWMIRERWSNVTADSK